MADIKSNREILTVLKLLPILRDNKLPAHGIVEIFNGGEEWRGIEKITTDQIKIIDGRLVIHFDGPWTDYDVDNYRAWRQGHPKGAE